MSRVLISCYHNYYYICIASIFPRDHDIITQCLLGARTLLFMHTDKLINNHNKISWTINISILFVIRSVEHISCLIFHVTKFKWVPEESSSAPWNSKTLGVQILGT